MNMFSRFSVGPSASVKHNGNASTEQFDYYGWVRHDLLRVVPDDARVVLSVGCGAGATEAELIKRGVRVFGIELNPAAAETARQRGLTVIQADASQRLTDVSGSFVCDCLIYGDVLEHLPDPPSVLEDHVRVLRPGGIVIVSVPNFRHYRVFVDLFLRGEIRYSDAGIFDRTHLRLTTRKMIERWLLDVGVSPKHCEYIAHGAKGSICSRVPAIIQEFVASQVVIAGEKR